MSLPLSKYYDPADLDQLKPELEIVDEHFTKDSPQSEHRRWEYAMALRALDTWVGPLTKATDLDGYPIDVGGAGSPFWRMVGGEDCRVIDPLCGEDLATYLRGCPRLAETVFCLSVLEHVDDLDQFCYHLSCLTAPGGLLFLTVDCCGCGICTDPHHFHEMRKRIFHQVALEELFGAMVVHYRFAPLGGTLGDIYDRSKYAPRLYGGSTDPGYSFASLALVKRR